MYEIPDWEIPGMPYATSVPKGYPGKVLHPIPKKATTVRTLKKKAKEKFLKKTEIITFVVTTEIDYGTIKDKNSLKKAFKEKLKDVYITEAYGIAKIKSVK